MPLVVGEAGGLRRRRDPSRYPGWRAAPAVNQVLPAMPEAEPDVADVLVAGEVAHRLLDELFPVRLITRLPEHGRGLRIGARAHLDLTLDPRRSGALLCGGPFCAAIDDKVHLLPE